MPARPYPASAGEGGLNDFFEQERNSWATEYHGEQKRATQVYFWLYLCGPLNTLRLSVANNPNLKS